MTPAEVIQAINANGLVKLPGYVDPVDSVLTEFDKLMAGLKDKSENFMSNNSVQHTGTHNVGKVVSVQRDGYKFLPQMVSVFDTKFFKEIVTLFYGRPADFMLQMYIAHDSLALSKEDWPRNAHLHFDPFQAVKFMLLLTDCSKENGAFRYIPGSQNYGRKCREKYSLDQLLHSSAYTLEDNPTQQYTEDQMIYCDGKPGDILVFNTDTLHGGGVLL
jgi:hypothetical protein